MSTSTTDDLVSSILAKPNKTSDDLHEIINKWHDDLLKNENYILEYAEKLTQKQQSLNQTTQSFIEAQDLLSNIDDNLDQFQVSIESLKKYNDEFERNVEQLNTETKTLLPNILANTKVEHDRLITYDLMESVDKQLNELDTTIKLFHEQLQLNTDNSIINTIDQLQTCFRDIDNIQDTIKDLKLETK